MANEVVKVPDLGGADSVEVIEISVSVGDQVAKEDSIVVLESDKATMEVPSPSEGTVRAILISEGDQLSEGAAILELEVGGVEEPEQPPAADVEVDQAVMETPQVEQASATSAASAIQDIIVPDLGTDGEVDVIEVAVAVGDQVSEGDSILVLETDKATVEMPAMFDGTIETITVSEGGKVEQGMVVGTMKTAGTASAAPVADTPAPQAAEPSTTSLPELAPAPAVESAADEAITHTSEVYAGPSVRKLARKLGVDLSQVKGTGQRNRIIKEDIETFVKQKLKVPAAATGLGIPTVPDIDFSQFGEITAIPLTKIQKVTAANMSRSWLNVPHVTQFDDADITDMESFRKTLKKEGEQRGVKLTPLAFMLLASAKALQQHPTFNRSLTSDGQSFIQKDYINIGIAVDTPRGLMVPVLKNADQKGLWQLAEEANNLAVKAREGKLRPNDMQGGCFSISSLGAIGGTGFTPIVNAPEIAILGISKSTMKPVWNGNEFEPRLMLPLALSYDHRALNGVDGGKFMTTFAALLSDTRRLAL